MNSLKTLLVILLFPFVFVTRYFKAFALLFLFLWIAGFFEQKQSEGNLIEIELIGAILDSTSFLEQLDEIQQDDSIQGILITIDSPGGALSPSVEIYEEIRRLGQKKPIVVYAQGTLASGSYYAALGAEKIIANKGAIVGSIGVILEGIDASELLNKIGIKPQTIKAGKYKESGTFMRSWEEHEKEELTDLLQKQYTMFVNDVCDARKLDCQKSDVFAEGKIFDSQTALQIGLIDSIGTKKDAKKTLASLAGVEGYEIWIEHDSFDIFLGKVSSLLQQKLHAFLKNVL